jgi:hypothetical protein
VSGLQEGAEVSSAERRTGATSAQCYTLLSAIGYEVEQANYRAGEHARGGVPENTAECAIELLGQFLLARQEISRRLCPV